MGKTEASCPFKMALVVGQSANLCAKAVPLNQVFLGFHRISDRLLQHRVLTVEIGDSKTKGPFRRVVIEHPGERTCRRLYRTRIAGPSSSLYLRRLIVYYGR